MQCHFGSWTTNHCIFSYPRLVTDSHAWLDDAEVIFRVRRFLPLDNGFDTRQRLGAMQLRSVNLNAELMSHIRKQRRAKLFIRYQM